MNDENLYKSFDALFEQNEGWIITKNEKGKIKVANCEEDETNLYEKTRDWKIVNVNETRMDLFKLPQNELCKTARFFIRDLLNSEKQDDHFVCKNIPYVNVFICGTVVSVYHYNDKYSIVVDDGTSSIKCFIEKERLDKIKENSVEMNELNKLFMQNKENVFLQAALMTKRSTKSLQELVPTFDELELGDVVKIFGTISEYNCNRYIFIKKIVKEQHGTIYHTTYLEDMLQLYSEEYID